MGRIVRGVLRTALESGDRVTLLHAERELWRDDPEPELLQHAQCARPASAARRSAYDVVWYPWNGIRFRAAAPALVHIHDTFALHERANFIARRRVRKPLWRAARDAKLIATDSAWSAMQIERDLSVAAERVVVIRPGPDTFFCVGGLESGDEAESLPRAPYVLMVGAEEPRKNALFLVESFSAAFPHQDVRLVIVGNVPTDARRAACERGVKLVLESDVDDVRLRSLYRNAACVAVPSLAEGFGLVVVEAQACGAPVIASDASALPEAAGGAALLVAPQDRSGWRDALRCLIEDETMASRLRALGVARWSSGDRAEPARAVLAVLHDLADRRA
jgi:glycosyltransferase involved in cell wall biosynthesis